MERVMIREGNKEAVEGVIREGNKEVVGRGHDKRG